MNLSKNFTFEAASKLLLSRYRRDLEGYELDKDYYPPQSSCYRGIGGAKPADGRTEKTTASKLLLSRYRRAKTANLKALSYRPPQSSCYRGIGGDGKEGDDERT